MKCTSFTPIDYEFDGVVYTITIGNKKINLTKEEFGAIFTNVTTFKDRLYFESMELRNRTQGLEDFINSPAFLKLNELQQTEMRKQLNHMYGYHNALIKRIDDVDAND